MIVTGRPFKIGLDYFLCSVDFLDDPKFRRVKREYGNVAILIYLAVICIAYKDKGYYIPYSNPDEKEDLHWQIRSKLDGKFQPDCTTIANVIDGLAACALLDGGLYRRGLITSRRIQECYYSATVDRKNVDVNFAFWLLDCERMKKLSSKSPILQNFISSPKNPVNRTNNEDNQANGTQRREEKTRVKKSIEYYIREEESTVLLSVEERFLNRFGVSPTDSVIAAAKKLLDEGKQLQTLLEAIDAAADNHSRNEKRDIFAYTIAVMRQYVPESSAHRQENTEKPLYNSDSMEGSL